MLASALRELALVDQDWLRQELVQTHPGSTVVVTHFAPSLRSADPRYGLTPGTAGFCNALDDLFRYADLWLHGHLHCPSDYVVSHGEHRCRVVANPRGYSSKGEQQTYRDGFCVDMDTPPARPG
jgi:DNA polymerase III epsilon subunit-like protein